MVAAQWNGTSLIIHSTSPEYTVTSAASGRWGCGVWYGTRWFQLQWNDLTAAFPIHVKEMISVVIASVLWGSSWIRGRVLALCNNEVVVTVINSSHGKDSHIMQMLQCLFFNETQCQSKLEAKHIPGSHNDLVDDLSRNRHPSSRKRSHSPVPPTVTATPHHGLDITSLDGAVQFFALKE